MARPRKLDKHLPAYVRIKSGAYYYRDQKLCRVDDGESKLYEALATRKALPSSDSIPAIVAQFKREALGALSPSVRKEHARILDVFAQDFSDFKVTEVSAVDIKRSMRNLYGDKRPAARAYKSRVSTFFAWCVAEEGLRPDNPCREVRTEKITRRKTKWTPELFWSMREKLHPIMQCYHDLTFLLYQRTTDVRRLMYSQISDGVIRFTPTKTEDSSGLSVNVPITPAIAAVLDRAKKLAKLQPGPGGDAPVIQDRSGHTYTRSGIYSAYLRADKALHSGTPIGLNSKALRPFAATMAKQQGFTTEQIKTGLAHASIGTTEGYIHQHNIPVSQVTLALPTKAGK
jgi:integrase